LTELMRFLPFLTSLVAWAWMGLVTCTSIVASSTSSHVLLLRLKRRPRDEDLPAHHTERDKHIRQMRYQATG
jgi:hypothetical protein